MTAYTLDSFEPDRSIGYLVRRIHGDGAALSERLFDEATLTFTQFAALVSVVFGRGRTCAMLARELGHDMGATSRVIDVLEARGLVTRRRDDADRRVLNLEVTDKGYREAAAVRERLVTQWNRWLDGWSRSEVETLIAGLQRLRATLAAERDGEEPDAPAGLGSGLQDVRP